MKIFGAIVSCLFLLAPVCHGQGFLFVRYTPKDGLINGRARFIVQDSRGRLYISTFGGLSVYDGSRFTNYNTENGLSTSLVNDILELGPDSLLVVPNTRALHLIVHGILRDVRTVDRFYPIANRLLRTETGELYAIADDGLFRFQGQRYEKVRLADAGGKEAGPFLIQAVAAQHKLFILTDPYLASYPGMASLLVYDPVTKQLLTAGKPDQFVALTRDPAGNVFAATEKGVRLVEVGEDGIRLKTPPPPYAAAAGIQSGSLLFDRSGSLWLTTARDVIEIDPAGNRVSIGPRGGFPAGLANSVFEDRERNIWITNTENGVSRLVSRGLRFYDSAAPGFAATDISADNTSDSVWYYDQVRHQLLLQTPGEAKRFYTDDPLPPNGHILFGKSAWLSTPGAVYQVKFTPGTDRFNARPVLTGPAVDGRTCIDRQGRLVISSTRILVIGEGRVWQRGSPELCDQPAVDNQGRIWATSRADSLMVLEPDMTPGVDTLRLIAAWPGILAKSPRSLCLDNAGHIWIGTRDHGLYCVKADSFRLQSWRKLTINEGLSEDFIRYLFCDPDNNIWAGTPSGLDEIRWINDSPRVANITPGHQLAIQKIRRSADGTHWVVVDGGFLRIGRTHADPEDHRPPDILFSQILVGNTFVATDPGHPVSLSYDRNAISFNVGVPSFIDESQTRYSYMLEGSSEAGWSPATRQSAINFVNLPPGKYTLWVKARFLSGIYPDTLGSYAFVIRPPWWQTTVFRIAALVSLLFVIGWAIRTYTRNRLKAQLLTLERQRAIEKERTRIATDMHDDLGAGLSRIKFLSDTIGIKQQRRLPIDEEIDGIREYSKEMIDKMGEIVWALNQKHDVLSDLLSYTRSYAAGYLMQAAIDARIDAPEELPQTVVSGEFRRNVYLAVKEALHNVVKHSQAQQVVMRMSVQSALTIVLQDNGVGFTRSAIRPYANGLLNMERRIAELGGRLEIRSGESGTTVTIEVPI
ncbi:MAG TPA: two-component regulator propeller domain-containing protein [Puia sp.]|nr:two-component regulator propeller domain-containing protein [Puia sp.]